MALSLTSSSVFYHTHIQKYFLPVFSSLDVSYISVCVFLQTGSGGEHPSGNGIQLICWPSIHLSKMAKSLIRGKEQSGHCLVLLDPH